MFTMANDTNNHAPFSSFIDQHTLPSLLLNIMANKYVGFVDWCRIEVCNALATALFNDFGFVSYDDLEMKVQTYVDSGYVAMLSSQFPVVTYFSPNSMSDGHVSMSDRYVSSTYAPPKYQVQAVQRGDSEDKFFCKPINTHLMDNASVIDTLNYGTDEQVSALPNLSCSCPAVKMKCDISCESILFVQATYTLMTEYGVTALPELYRFLGMLGDRKCVTCKLKTGNKISCVSGTFQCINCLNKHKRKDFSNAFKAWLDAGCPAKHAVLV